MFRRPVSYRLVVVAIRSVPGSCTTVVGAAVALAVTAAVVATGVATAVGVGVAVVEGCVVQPANSTARITASDRIQRIPEVFPFMMNELISQGYFSVLIYTSKIVKMLN